MQGVPKDKIRGDSPSILRKCHFSDLLDIASYIADSIALTVDETRIRYAVAEKHMNGFLAQIRDAINDSIEVTEEQLGDVLNILRGAKDEVVVKWRQAYNQAEKAMAAAERQ